MTDEQIVEAVRKTLISWVFAETQPDRGDVFSWFDDRADTLARAIIPLVQQKRDADVVKWLRDSDYWTWRDTDRLTRDDYADAIERGEHTQESQP